MEKSHFTWTNFWGAGHQHAANSSPEQLLFTLIKMIDIVFEPEFVDVMHEIAKSGNLVRDHIIEAAAYHRIIELLKAFRHRTELSWNERIALSILGSSFDSDSVQVIVDKLESDDFTGDVLSILQTVRRRSEDAQRTIDTALSLFKLAS